jgi:hypothetical protein
MSDHSTITSISALAQNLMVERANQLSGPQAFEMWRVIKLIATDLPPEGTPGAVIQSAINFNSFGAARKIVEEKALAYEHLTSEHKTVCWLTRVERTLKRM